MSFRVGQGACSFLMAGLLVASALVAGHPSHVLKMGPPPRFRTEPPLPERGLSHRPSPAFSTFAPALAASSRTSGPAPV